MYQRSSSWDPICIAIIGILYIFAILSLNYLNSFIGIILIIISMILTVIISIYYRMVSLKRKKQVEKNIALLKQENLISEQNFRSGDCYFLDDYLVSLYPQITKYSYQDIVFVHRKTRVTEYLETYLHIILKDGQDIEIFYCSNRKLLGSVMYAVEIKEYDLTITKAIRYIKSKNPQVLCENNKTTKKFLEEHYGIKI